MFSRSSYSCACELGVPWPLDSILWLLLPSRDAEEQDVERKELHALTGEESKIGESREPNDEQTAVDEGEGHVGSAIIKDLSPLLLAWDLSDPRLLELRYEELIAELDRGFEALFTHYGFNREAVERGISIALQFSIERMAATKGSHGGSHVRSGRPGEWRELFTNDHKGHFKEAGGDLLIRLGYEADDKW